MAYFENINLGKYGENIHRYTMRCTDAYCSNIEEKIREFLSRSAEPRLAGRRYDYEAAAGIERDLRRTTGSDE